ncbi:MAG: hypothetical protein R3C68_07915 [Myxococcota bacterium]
MAAIALSTTKERVDLGFHGLILSVSSPLLNQGQASPPLNAAKCSGAPLIEEAGERVSEIIARLAERAITVAATHRFGPTGGGVINFGSKVIGLISLMFSFAKDRQHTLRFTL